MVESMLAAITAILALMLARNGFGCMGGARGATVLAQASGKLEGEHLHAVLAFCRVPEPKPQ